MLPDPVLRHVRSVDAHLAELPALVGQRRPEQPIPDRQQRPVVSLDARVLGLVVPAMRLGDSEDEPQQAGALPDVASPPVCERLAGSGGIGALARELASAGHAITLVGRSGDALARVAASLGVPTRAAVVDLARIDEATQWIAGAEVARGPIDVLVNNAGTGTTIVDRFEDVVPSEVQRLQNPFRTAQPPAGRFQDRESVSTGWYQIACAQATQRVPRTA